MMQALAEIRAQKTTLLRELRMLEKVESELVNELAPACKHPIEVRVDYQWEHDNGYGVQKMITGEKCTICGAKRSWKGMSGWWWHST